VVPSTLRPSHAGSCKTVPGWKRCCIAGSARCGLVGAWTRRPSRSGAYWTPGSDVTSTSMSAPSNALPRLLILGTHAKKPRYRGSCSWHWWRVFRRAGASRMGHGGRSPLHTRAVGSAPCMVPVAKWETGMGVLPALFRPCAPDVLILYVCVFRPLWQEVRAICTTKNRFKIVHNREEVADGTLG
jgi:hypothetical protein